MELTSEQWEDVQDVFDAFDQHAIQYVVLRGYAELPERLQGRDFDVLVDPDDFGAAVELLDRLGLESLESRGEPVLSLVADGVQQPVRAAAMLVKSPGDVFEHVRRTFSPAPMDGPEVVDRSFDAGVRVHLVNHLAYTSPLSGSKIRVDPAVETEMLTHRVEHAGLRVPDAPDELAHLVCRGVFDYDGTFPEYYRQRCDDLVAELRADSTRYARFESLLELVFFRAWSLVAETVLAGEYDEIRGRLTRFSEY